MKKGWLLNELEKAQSHASKLAEQNNHPKPKNPRPAGVIQGETTQAVHDFLMNSSGWHTFGQIQIATKGSYSAIAWALIRLRSWSKIECKPDCERNPRFLRYRFIRDDPEMG